MKKNIGKLDRSIRILIALLFMICYFTNFITGTLGIIALIIAGVFILTSIVGFCPLYALFGFSTCKNK